MAFRLKQNQLLVRRDGKFCRYSTRIDRKLSSVSLKDIMSPLS